MREFCIIKSIDIHRDNKLGVTDWINVDGYFDKTK
jgi:hypothetical protein